MDSSSLSAALRSLYYSPRKGASFSSVQKLWDAVRAQGYQISRKEVEHWLQQQDTFTLHRNRRVRYPRTRYNVNNLDDLWEMDLVDLQSLSKFNDRYKYLLTIIDVFSRFAFVLPLRSKRTQEVTQAFQKLLKESKRQPLVLQTDSGGEFLSRDFQSLLKKKHIEHRIPLNTEIKCSVVERFNRTLKSRMWKYFTAHGSYRYIHALADIVHGYNRSIHSSIKMAPASVNETNVLRVWQTLRKQGNTKPHKFLVGDSVRISKHRLPFQKGYLPNWSNEVFTIHQIVQRTPVPVYVIKDLHNTVIEGTFYEQELQKIVVTPNTEYRIEKILKQRKGGREYLVRWAGYDESFDSWVPAKDVHSVQQQQHG